MPASIMNIDGSVTLIDDDGTEREGVPPGSFRVIVDVDNPAIVRVEAGDMTSAEVIEAIAEAADPQQ